MLVVVLNSRSRCNWWRISLYDVNTSRRPNELYEVDLTVFDVAVVW